MNRNGAFIVLIVLLAIFGGILYWSINQPVGLVTESSSIEEIVPIGEEIHWNGYKITSPTVIDENGVRRLWYVGNGPTNRSGIGYATTTPGNTEWNIETTDSPQMPTTQEWEDGGIRSAEVDRYSNYILWYSAEDFQTNALSIGVAVSNDGLNWIKQANNPIIEATTTDWYAGGIDDPSVVYHNGIYHMLFTGIKEDGTTAIGHASSTDRSRWTIHPEPVFEGQADWDSYSVSDPHIRYIGNGLYELWFTGKQEKNGYSAFGRAYSNDALIWVEDTKVNPMVAQTDMSMEEAYVLANGDTYEVFASVIEKENRREPLYTAQWPEATSTE